MKKDGPRISRTQAVLVLLVILAISVAAYIWDLNYYVFD